MLQGQEQAIIMGHRSVVGSVDAPICSAECRIEQGKAPARLGIRGCGTRSEISCWVNLATVAPEMGGLVTQITYRGHPGTELALIGDVPIRHVRGFGIDGHVDIDARSREISLALGKWISARITLPRIRQSPHWVRNVKQRAYRRVGGFPLVVPSLRYIVKDGAANPERVAPV